jgi:hypothetical protein
MYQKQYLQIPEKAVQKLLVNSMRRQGYQVVEQCLDDPTEFDDITECATSNIFGIDVVGQKGKVLWVIEVKGQPKGGTASCHSVFMAGIAQILTRMTKMSPDIHYGLAIPNTDMFVPAVRKFIRLPIMRLLNLSIILIQEDGSTELLGNS